MRSRTRGPAIPDYPAASTTANWRTQSTGVRLSCSNDQFFGILASTTGSHKKLSNVNLLLHSRDSWFEHTDAAPNEGFEIGIIFSAMRTGLWTLLGFTLTSLIELPIIFFCIVWLRMVDSLDWFCVVGLLS